LWAATTATFLSVSFAAAEIVEQETQLLHEGIYTFLRGYAKLLMPGKAKCFYEQIHTTFKLRDFLSLSLELLIFRAEMVTISALLVCFYLSFSCNYSSIFLLKSTK